MNDPASAVAIFCALMALVLASIGLGFVLGRLSAQRTSANRTANAIRKALREEGALVQTPWGKYRKHTKRGEYGTTMYDRLPDEAYR